MLWMIMGTYLILGLLATLLIGSALTASKQYKNKFQNREYKSPITNPSHKSKTEPGRLHL